MNVALKVLPSLGVYYLLIVVKYVLRSNANFNNWPMVTIILLSIMYCPTSSLTFREMGVGVTFGCSIEDGNPTHSVGQNGFVTIVTSCIIPLRFSSP
jgi:hypothetical protein